MAHLFDLLSAYPVAETLAQALPLASLVNLSKVNAEHRAILHGFPRPIATKDGEYESKIRPDLYICFHQTDYWRNLKIKSQLLCSEQKHTKGPNPRGCRMCSMPVCEGCIVKGSFGKHENTFQNRRRHLCVECWLSGNRHSERRLDHSSADKIPYTSAVGAEDFCSCAAKDGWLCSKCKTGQKVDLHVKLNRCCGEGCDSILEVDKATRRICLWCDLPLFGNQSTGILCGTSKPMSTLAPGAGYATNDSQALGRSAILELIDLGCLESLRLACCKGTIGPP